MEKIVIMGCGDLVLPLADAILKKEDELLGVLDDQDTAEAAGGYPLLGKLADWHSWADQGCLFIAGSADRSVRRGLFEKFPEIPWTRVIHPAAVTGLGASVGPGSFIGAGTILGAGASVGAHTVIEAGGILGTSAAVGDFCQLLSRVNAGSRVSVGAHSFIGQSATLKDGVKIAENTVIQTGEIVVKDMVMKMVFKRGAWIYKENG
ncbi:MAG: hypothetical protein Q4C55_04085 [Eubacterium sp.]|nr:hypothetical protein [Eubacterium sp.]